MRRGDEQGAWQVGSGAEVPEQEQRSLPCAKKYIQLKNKFK
jgi:hypothetical protein